MIERKIPSSIAATTDQPAYSLEGGFVSYFEGHRLRCATVEWLSARLPAFHSGDWARALGYRDSNCILRLLGDDGEGTLWVPHEVRDPKGGTQQGKWLLLAGCFEVCALSRKPPAKRMRRWITTDVMPGIAKSGFYLHPEAERAGVRVIGAPDTTPVTEPAANIASALADDHETALVVALEAVRARKAAEARALAATAEAEAARVIVADLVPAVQGTRQLHDETARWKLDTAARMLGIGPHKLRAWLRERKILIRPHEYDEPAMAHVDNGRFALRAGKSWTNPRTGEEHIGDPVVLVTAKGLAWLAACLAADRVLDDDVGDVLARAEALITRALPPAKEDEQ